MKIHIHSLSHTRGYPMPRLSGLPRSGMMTGKAKGFSLIEVLFALFLIALVIGVSTKVASNSVNNMTYVKESTFARWVALNQLERYKIAQDNATFIDNQGEETMGTLQWRWELEVLPSSSTDLNEVRVSVYRESDGFDEAPVAIVKGYIATENQF